ncbi:hypothetical protein A9X02_12215 [Mycobacterium malmoense]|nr:hypothetical protein A9X02_12215 [Mycobacterium malmoense]
MRQTEGADSSLNPFSWTRLGVGAYLVEQDDVEYGLRLSICRKEPWPFSGEPLPCSIMQPTPFLLHSSKCHKIRHQGARPLSTPFTPIHFRLVITVPGLVESRYRGIIEVELRHDSRDALADLQGFEFDSVELFGHLAADGITDHDIAAASHDFTEIPPGPTVSRAGLIGRGHVVAAIHSQLFGVPAVSLYRSVQILLNTRCEELDDEQ